MRARHRPADARTAVACVVHCVRSHKATYFDRSITYIYTTYLDIDETWVQVVSPYSAPRCPQGGSLTEIASYDGSAVLAASPEASKPPSEPQAEGGVGR